MTINRTEQSGLPVLCVQGPLVGRNWPRFVGQLKLVIYEGHHRIGVDLGGVIRMGQAEAQFLLDARNRLARQQRELVLVGLSPASIEALSQACKAPLP